MKVVIAGATGLIGQALCVHLAAGGHEITRLVRRDPGPADSIWAPLDGRLDASVVDGADAVVNVAGEPVGGRRWNDAYKSRILRSRTEGTRLLAEAISSASSPPTVFANGSAIGIYGDRGDETLSETSAPGSGFLAEVVAATEAAATPALDATRVVHLRTSVVLTPDGGALAKQLPLFRFGLGGRLASGRQWFPWISLPDEIAAIEWCLTHDDLSGPVNLAAPGAVTNRDFTTALARALHRPALFPVPGIALRIVLGEMSGELLASARVVPSALQRSGFTFAHPSIDEALTALL